LQICPKTDSARSQKKSVSLCCWRDWTVTTMQLELSQMLSSGCSTWAFSISGLYSIQLRSQL